MRPQSKPTSDRSELHPARALLTPAWLGALALLVANDHWLKGGGVLPGVLTGKLSDFAGLLVAPVLLATLLRVRSRRGLLACHVAVGLVFAGIQLSSGFAGLWSSAMGLFGHPWVITCDPTDLVALPFLWLSWRLLTPAMDGSRPALMGLQRSAVAAASVFGLWATVATSDDSSGDDGCWGCWDDTDTDGWGDGDGDLGGWEDVVGQVYMHNPNDFGVNITVRVLLPDVDLDCAAIGVDPSRLLPDDAFGPAEHWMLPATTNVGIVMPMSCGAAKIGGEGIQDQIIFSTTFAGPETFAGSHEPSEELGPRGAAIVMTVDGSEWVGGDDWRYTPKSDSAPVPEHCEPAPAEQRVSWSELPGQVVVEVLSMNPGLDGCHELELLPWAGENYGETFTWYLCTPQAVLPFELGAYYRLMSFQETGDMVEARLVDPLTHAPATDDDGLNLLTARWVRGVHNAGLLPISLGAAAVEVAGCPWLVADEGCSSVERPLALSLSGGAVEVVAGEPAVVEDLVGMRHELLLGRARALALIDSTCASGSGILPHDIDYTLVTEPANL